MAENATVLRRSRVAVHARAFFLCWRGQGILPADESPRRTALDTPHSSRGDALNSPPPPRWKQPVYFLPSPFSTDVARPLEKCQRGRGRLNTVESPQRKAQDSPQRSRGAASNSSPPPPVTTIKINNIGYPSMLGVSIMAMVDPKQVRARKV